MVYKGQFGVGKTIKAFENLAFDKPKCQKQAPKLFKRDKLISSNISKNKIYLSFNVPFWPLSPLRAWNPRTKYF